MWQWRARIGNPPGSFPCRFTPGEDRKHIREEQGVSANSEAVDSHHRAGCGGWDRVPIAHRVPSSNTLGEVPPISEKQPIARKQSFGSQHGLPVPSPRVRLCFWEGRMFSETTWRPSRHLFFQPHFQRVLCQTLVQKCGLHGGVPSAVREQEQPKRQHLL